MKCNGFLLIAKKKYIKRVTATDILLKCPVNFFWISSICTAFSVQGI